MCGPNNGENGLYIVNRWRAYTAGYGTWSVCVCLSVCLSAAILHYRVAARERYQRIQNHVNLKTKMAIFLKRLRSCENKRKSQSHQLTSTDQLALCIYTLRKSPTKAVHRLPHRHAILRLSVTN